MLKRIFRFLILLPLSVYFISFAIYNHQSVEVTFYPLLLDEKPFSVAMPFYLIIFSTLMLGVFVGGIAAWLRQARYRLKAKVETKEAQYWRLEAERLARERDLNILSNTGKFSNIYQKN